MERGIAMVITIRTIRIFKEKENRKIYRHKNQIKQNQKQAKSKGQIENKSQMVYKSNQRKIKLNVNELKKFK